MSRCLFNVRKYRNSRPKIFCKKGVLKNFAKFTGKHLCQAEACNFIKKLYWLWHRVYFSVYFSVIFQNSLGTKFWIFAPKFAQKSECYLNSYYKCDRYCKVCKVWLWCITSVSRQSLLHFLCFLNNFCKSAELLSGKLGMAVLIWENVSSLTSLARSCWLIWS